MRHNEHCYAEDWAAMRAYHYLMRIGHLLNVLAAFASTLVGSFKERGAQGFIEWVRGTLSGRWLGLADLKARAPAPPPPGGAGCPTAPRRSSATSPGSHGEPACASGLCGRPDR